MINKQTLKRTIFRENDIRGKYPQEVNEEVAFLLARVFVLFLKKIYQEPLKLVIGYDNRQSSPSLAQSFIKGCLANGCQIINLGETTTPLFYFSLNKTKNTGGVMITASHNPYRENGFLFYLKGGVSFLSGTKWDRKFLELAFQEYRNKKKFLINSSPNSQITNLNFQKYYLDYLKKFIKVKKPLKFVLDDGGGSAGFILKNFNKKVNRKLLKLYLVKGRKYRFSNPLEEKKLNLLKKEIIRRKANGGAAFDSDADRIVFLDEKGQIIDSGKIFGFLIKNFLKRDEKIKFVTTEFLNQKIKQEVKKLGAKLIYSPTGYGYFYLKMKKARAFFGSEHTGHYYFKDFNYHDDGLLALIFVLNFLSRERKSFSELVKEFSLNSYFFMNFKSLPAKSFLMIKILKSLTLKYQKPTFEHLKLKTKNWLMIWRISGTSNILRVYVEKL
ncbi:MAG: hypothetical protein ACP5OX_01025 [Minisyncoccia bacterium]